MAVEGDGGPGMRIARFLLIVLIDIVAWVAVTIWVVKQPGALSGSTIVLAGIGGVAFIAAGAFHCLWRPMLAPFPPREPAPDAVRRRFQSFSVGPVNMGLSIHAAADEECLHLVPLALWQRLGARPASIPWSAMEPAGRSGRIVRVAGLRIIGPKWCMQLAGSPSRAGVADESQA